MTIERESRRSDVYLGDGRNTSLPFGFKVFLPTEIAVVLNEGGVERTLSHGHGCTVSLNAEQDVQPGGAVRLDAPLPTGSKAVVLSNVRPLQQVDLTNQGGFYPDVLNAVHDRLTMLIQQLMDTQARMPQAPATNNATGQDLTRQIMELSSSLPEVLRLLNGEELKKLLNLLKNKPNLGGVELSSAVDSEREDVAATSKAAKIAYDKADGAAIAATNANNAAAAAKKAADRKADTNHTHTHNQISDWDSALTQTIAQALAAAMPAVKSETGYMKMPNGLIIQWGLASDNGDPKNFPIAFPNKALILVGSAKWHAASKETSINANIIDNARFTMINGNGYDNDTSPNYWIAIGY